MNRRLPALAALALSGALVLTACTPSEPVNTKTPAAAESAAPSPTPTPTVKTPPTQKPAAAPEDQEQAILDANAAYKEYLTVWFEFLKDPELTPDYVSGYIAPLSKQADVAQATYDAKIENKQSVEGSPFTWTLNAPLSYPAGTTDPQTGEKDPLGSVVLVGCSDNTGVTFLIDGEPNDSVPSGAAPFQALLMYSPAADAWLVSESKSLSDMEGAPLC